MTDVRGLAVELTAIALMERRLAELKTTVRAELAAALDPGDRKTAALTDGTVVGAVTYTRGKTTARVADSSALLAWVRDTYPDEVVQQVRGSFQAALLKRATDAGAPVDTATGETIPGIAVTTGDPFISCKPNPEAAAALVDAMRHTRLLALENTGDTA